MILHPQSRDVNSVIVAGPEKPFFGLDLEPTDVEPYCESHRETPVTLDVSERLETLHNHILSQ
jgi:hypothetical protein